LYQFSDLSSSVYAESFTENREQSKF